jgi:DNA-binding MarR family transcriptional regulator
MLLLIDANPGVTQGRLAQAVGLDRSTMVGVIDALESRRLLERRRGEDRRTNGLWLTSIGRGFVARLKKRIEAHERRVAAQLTAAERAQLLALLEKLAG